MVALTRAENQIPNLIVLPPAIKQVPQRVERTSKEMIQEMTQLPEHIRNRYGKYATKLIFPQLSPGSNIKTTTNICATDMSAVVTPETGAVLFLSKSKAVEMLAFPKTEFNDRLSSGSTDKKGDDTTVQVTVTNPKLVVNQDSKVEDEDQYSIDNRYYSAAKFDGLITIGGGPEDYNRPDYKEVQEERIAEWNPDALAVQRLTKEMEGSLPDGTLPYYELPEVAIEDLSNKDMVTRTPLEVEVLIDNKDIVFSSRNVKDPLLEGKESNVTLVESMITDIDAAMLGFKNREFRLGHPEINDSRYSEAYIYWKSGVGKVDARKFYEDFDIVMISTGLIILKDKTPEHAGSFIVGVNRADINGVPHKKLGCAWEMKRFKNEGMDGDAIDSWIDGVNNIES